MMWKTQQAMQDDAIRTARIHPAVHPSNRDEVFIWQNFQSAYRDLGASSYEPGQPGSYEEALRTQRILEKRRTSTVVTASPGWKQSIFLQPVSSRPLHMQLHMSLVDRAEFRLGFI